MLCESTWLKVVWIKGRHQWKKKRFLLGIARNTYTPPDPNSGNLVLFFGRQNSRFESHLMGGEGDILTT